MRRSDDRSMSSSRSISDCLDMPPSHQIALGPHFLGRGHLSEGDAPWPWTISATSNRLCCVLFDVLGLPKSLVGSSLTDRAFGALPIRFDGVATLLLVWELLGNLIDDDNVEPRTSDLRPPAPSRIGCR